ncbi:MAG TPA: hypothetical protein VK762_37400, partial [Polyangiaceae bacterium]|nr:hypothetical protein [Polyangiaceae bacterium]
MSKAPPWQLVVLVSLTLGCGARTGLLVDDAVPVADAMPDVDATVEDRTSPGDAAEVADRDVGASDASSEVGTEETDADGS